MRSWREPFGADLNQWTISSFVIFAILEPVSAPWVAAHRKAVHWFGYRRRGGCDKTTRGGVVSGRAGRPQQGARGVVSNGIATTPRAAPPLSNARDKNRHFCGS